MRTLAQLEKGTQTRLRDYISKWPTMSTKDLANDLYLRNTTVAAVKAHLTRSMTRRFNELMGG